MIKIIGFKKIFLIAVLLACSVGLYFYSFVFVSPNNALIERRVSGEKSATAVVETNMQQLVAGMELFGKQKDNYKNLEVLGFFDNQDRLRMRRYFSEMQKLSGVLSARYTIDALQVEDNKKAKEAGYKLVKTEISSQLEAFQHRDIYRIIYFLNYGFPGNVSIDSLSLSRSAKITPTLLQKIGVGGAPPVVTGSLDVSLRTLVLDEEAQKNDDVDAYNNEGGM